MHQTTLERVFGRIFAAFVALSVVVFWFSSSTLRGQRPGCVAADLLLSVLLIWQAARALRRPPSQRDLYLLAAAAGSPWAARLLRAGARRADADADALSRRMAAQDAALAAEEAERRAANAVHDDVLSVRS